MLESTSEEDVYCCRLCSYQSERAFQVHHHVNRTHKNVNDTVGWMDATAEPEQLFCIGCDFMSQHKLALYEHCKQKHQGPGLMMATNVARNRNDCERFVGYKCTACQLETHAALSLVANHRCRNEANVRIIDGASCRPQTKRRKKLVDDYDAMVRNVDNTGLPFRCAQCSYATNVKSNLKRHATQQHANDADIAWYKCEHCDYSTKYKHGLQSHVLQRHANDEEVEWHLCEHCAYRTKAKCNLKKHMLKHASHEQIKWHECEQCSYKAKQKMHLKQHMLTHAAHDQIKWFECEHCEYKAKTKVHVKRHTSRRHPEAAVEILLP